MAKYYDFYVDYDPETETEHDLTFKIFRYLFLRRIKAKKPCIVGVFGKSSEGKSETTLGVMDDLLNCQGIEIEPYLENINIFTPFEYATKTKNFYFNKDIKKVNVLALQEARNVARASQWQTFLSECVNDINNQSRKIKPTCMFIISQWIKDITKNTRFTLDYYIEAYRPIGYNVQWSVYVTWTDNKDIERPVLRKRKVRGVIRYPDGTRRVIFPTYFEMPRARTELVKKFEEMDFNAKEDILRRKLEKLVEEMETEQGIKNSRVKVIVEHFLEHGKEVGIHGKLGKRGYKLSKESQLMYGMVDSEVKEFEKTLYEKMKSKGMLGEREDDKELEDYEKDNEVKDDD